MGRKYNGSGCNDDTDIAAGRSSSAGIYGTALSRDTARRLEARTVGGVILMGRNVESPASGAIAPGRDHHGGDQERAPSAARRRPGRGASGAASPGALDRAAPCADAWASSTTRSSRAGLCRYTRRSAPGSRLHLDFTPVLDVDGGDRRAVVGDRSFSGDARDGRRQGCSRDSKGLLQAGICPCGKHFPGHGATVRQPRGAAACASRGRDELEQRELVPFVGAVEAGLPLIMPAHVVFEAIDPERPATISPASSMSSSASGSGFAAP